MYTLANECASIFIVNLSKYAEEEKPVTAIKVDKLFHLSFYLPSFLTPLSESCS